MKSDKQDNEFSAGMVVCVIAIALLFLIFISGAMTSFFNGGAFAIVGVFILILLAFLAVIPASIASKKGYGFGAFYLFGLCFFVPALIVALLIQDKNEERVVSNVGAADELIKFKKLLDEDVITKEEFEKKKRALLGGSRNLSDVPAVQILFDESEVPGQQEYWTCPKCGESWYAGKGKNVAKCGNPECGMKVRFLR